MITLSAEMESFNKFILGSSKFGDAVGSDTKNIIDNTKLISLESSIQSRQSEDDLTFGIISNTCSIEFNDSDDKYKSYAEKGKLQDGVETKIYINNSITKSKELAGTYYTEDWDYDINNKSVSVSLKDGLMNFQNIQNNGYQYLDKNSYLIDVYNSLKADTEKLGYKFAEIGKDTKLYRYFTTTIGEYLYIEKGNLWDIWQKFCDASSCHMFMNHFGEIEFNYEFEDL